MKGSSLELVNTSPHIFTFSVSPSPAPREHLCSTHLANYNFKHGVVNYGMFLLRYEEESIIGDTFHDFGGFLNLSEPFCKGGIKSAHGRPGREGCLAPWQVGSE